MVGVYVLLVAIIDLGELSEHAALIQNCLDRPHDRLRFLYFHFTLVTTFLFDEQVF